MVVVFKAVACKPSPPNSAESPPKSTQAPLDDSKCRHTAFPAGVPSNVEGTRGTRVDAGRGKGNHKVGEGLGRGRRVGNVAMMEGKGGVRSFAPSQVCMVN